MRAGVKFELRHPCASFVTLVTGSLKYDSRFFLGAPMKKWWFLILPTIVFLVSCLDLGATLYCAKNISGFEEGNPIARHIWDYYGDISFMAFKLCVTMASCNFMRLVLQHKNRRWRIAVSVFGLSVCVMLLGWWLFWFLLWNTAMG